MKMLPTKLSARTMLTNLFLVAAVLAALGCASREGAATGQAAAARPETDAAQAAAPRTTRADAPPDLGKYFKDNPGTFVLYDLKNDTYLRHDAARAAKRFSPYSTFKVPNSLIGLESGVIKDADFVIKWDEKKYPRYGTIAPFTTWWRDHTLRTALKNSVVWYYRELALGVGAQGMKEYVAKLNYGNRDTSGGVDRFWLNSTLQISADEQVEFLKAFYKEELPFSKRSVRIVKEILTLEETPNYKLSAKTGGGPVGEDKTLGWFVGYLEAKGNVYFFAMQIEGPNYLAIRDKRIEITRRILTDLGHLPSGQ